MSASGMPSSSPTRQAKISTFFSQPKRPSAALIDLTGDSPEPEEPPLKKQRNGKAERWRFDPSSSPQKVAATAESGPSQIASKDAYRKKLLSGNNTSTARKPASESKASESDSDHAFDELSAFFSAKSAKGQKKKATRKPVEEIGPSGETYTPLENQVNLHKCSVYQSSQYGVLSGSTPEERESQCFVNGGSRV